MYTNQSLVKMNHVFLKNVLGLTGIIMAVRRLALMNKMEGYIISQRTVLVPGSGCNHLPVGVKAGDIIGLQLQHISSGGNNGNVNVAHLKCHKFAVQ